MAKITIIDKDGKKISTFDANSDESILDQAQNNGADIPFSCGVGACQVCKAKVKKGQEHLDSEAIGPQHVPTEKDEVLTCICGLKKDAPKDTEIILEVEDI